MTISFDIVPRTLNKFDDISFLFSEYREFYGIKDCNCESKNSLKKIDQQRFNNFSCQ